MSDIDINQMDFKQLRNEVQMLRDELAIFKRKYEDIIYNLDDDNFSSTLLREKEGMKTSIEQTEESIKLQAEKIDGNSTKIGTLEVTAEQIESEVFEENEDGTKTSRITQTAKAIEQEVTNRTNADMQLSSSIRQSANEISAIISGSYAEEIVDGINEYLTGIEITPNQIKMIATATAYSIFNGDGLKFYDSMNQVEGWSIEPAEDYGGLLNYYVNDGLSYSFGARPVSEHSNCTARGYAYTDMCLVGYGYRGRFVVDVTDSNNSEVKFVGLADWSTNSDTPRIYANEQLLATQNWVLENGGGSGGSGTAVFG